MADLIDRQALLNDIEQYHLSDGKFQHWVEVQPSVDAVEVVRCADCKHCQVDTLYHNYWCDGQSVWADHYCSKGERR